MAEREHFDSSLGGWAALTAGDGTVTVTDSCARLEMFGAVGGAVMYRALPHTKDHIFACCVRSGQQNPSPRMRIFDKSTAPAHGSPGTEAFNIDFYVGATTRARFNYWNTTPTQQTWNDSTKAWSATTSVNSVPNVQFDDFHIIGYQWDATNARIRFFFINVSAGTTQTEACGPKIFGLSDWVNHSAIRGGTSSTLWIAIGHFDNGNAFTGVCDVEWTRFEDGAKVLGATNQDSAASSYSTKLWESFGGRCWLPSGASPQRTSQITFPGVQSWCTSHTQFGAGIEEDNGDLWFFFNGGTGGGSNSVGVTKSTDGGLTWTPYTSNPIIAAVASTDLHNLVHMGCVKDMLEPDASKRYKLVVSSQLQNGDRKIFLFTAAQPDTTSWTNEGAIAGPDGDSATGYEGSHMNPIHYNGEWLLMNGAWLWRGPRLAIGSLTKQAFDLALGFQNVSQVASALSSTSRTVDVTSSTGFVQDALVVIDDDTSTDDWALNRVRKNVDSDTFEMYHRTPGYAANATINRLDAGKWSLHAVRYDPQRREWCFHLSFFAVFDTYNNGGAVAANLQAAAIAVSSSPLVIPTVDWFDCPQAWLARDDNQRTSENMKFFDKPVRGDLLHGYPKRPPRLNAALRR